MPKQKKVTVEKKPSRSPVMTEEDVREAFATIRHDELLAVKKSVEAHWEEQAEHYGWDDPEKPEPVQRRLQAILGATSHDEARALARKAQATIQVMLLGAWARGKIPGPTTERSVEKRVKRTESLAQMLEAKGQLEAAERQWEKARQLRLQLEEIRESSPALTPA